MNTNHLIVVTTAAMLSIASFQVRAAETVATATERPQIVARADIPYHRAGSVAAKAPRSVGERNAMAAAVKGPDALRRYVDRTRMIYGYRYEDFAPQ